jgi:GTP-binding protein Era
MTEQTPGTGFRCGYIAIVGRPNVGKSTLMNALIGAKVSITSRKAQTTRHRITGIQTSPDAQLIYVDTPGFQTRHSNALNRTLNRTVTNTLSASDVILMVVEAGTFGPADQQVIDLLPSDVPAILVINKSDRVKDKAALMPFAHPQGDVDWAKRRAPERNFDPVAARHGKAVWRTGVSRSLGQGQIGMGRQ